MVDENTVKSKVLVVDDEPSISRTLSYRLRASGFEVFVANDGVEGLESVYANSPDLVILDIMMPRMNGYEVCQRLRIDPHFKNLPVIMLTAKAQKLDQKWGTRIGANAYMTKPFDSKELIAKMHELLEKAASGESMLPEDDDSDDSDDSED